MELPEDSFVYFFKVQCGQLICDGKNRIFSNIFECILSQWTKISKETKTTYKITNHLKSNSNLLSVEEKCEEFYQIFKQKLDGAKKPQENSKEINICKFCSKNYQNLDFHLIRKHAEYVYTQQSCDLCQENFKSPQDLYKHFSQNHRRSTKLKEKRGRKKLINKDEAKTTCKECEIPFQTSSQFKYHRLKIHGKWQGTFNCGICSKKLSTMSNLQRHKKIAHKGKKLSIIPKSYVITY